MKRVVIAMFVTLFFSLPAMANKTVNDGFAQYVDVAIQDQTTEPVNMYLYNLEASTTLTKTAVVDAATFEVTSATGIDVADVLTVYEDIYFFQTLVKNINGTSIGVQSPIDHAFTSAAVVEVGAWKFNVDGSSTNKTYKIKAPPNASFDIYALTITMTDNADMDSAKFGGLTALTNGVLFRHANGVNKNLSFVVNNIGFSEIGYALEYDPKAPAGVYGLRCRKQINQINGVAIRIFGPDGDELQFIVRDDLTGLTIGTVTATGHRVKNP